MTATFYIGDALEVMAKLPEKSVDLVLSSPPFLALRSYLPADHPDKSKEGGSQATPGEYIDWLVDVAEACARVLAPHGSLCFELGDTYAGSGGTGGDYNEEGLREGQPIYKGSNARKEHRVELPDGRTIQSAGISNGLPRKGTGWPLPKSLSLIPELFRLTLVYGTNPLTGRQTDRWRLRNVIRWVRPNPPVGALGDKFRPATSELMVFCKSAKRYFDLDAVRTEPTAKPQRYLTVPAEGRGRTPESTRLMGDRYLSDEPGYRPTNNPAGAPPLDWWELEGDEPPPQGDKKITSKGPSGISKGSDAGERQTWRTEGGAPPLDWWNIPPGGYVTSPERVDPGEYVGGTLYIVSEGCPLHEGQLGRIAMARRDEPVDAPSNHSPDTDTSPVPTPPADSVPTDQPTAPNLWDGNSDSPDPEPPPAATPRSKASNRTAPVPATTIPDNASDKTQPRTGDTSGEPPSGEPHPDMPESKTAAVYRLFPVLESYAHTGRRPVELEGCECSFYVADDSTGHYAIKPGKPRNRQSEPAMARGGNWNTFPNYESTHPLGVPPLDWWNIPPGGYQGSHYAVFPPELCVKPIKAMSPEQVCRECGEPSRRLSSVPQYVSDKTGAPVEKRSWLSGERQAQGAIGVDTGVQRVSETLGFSDCGHNNWRPGLVLDPFVGSGTVLAVATGHGREAWGIDLDSRNADLARERVGALFFEVVDARS